jgi:peroxiredoxin
MIPLVIALALPWLVVALVCWLGLQLVRQNGRILLRLDALEQRFLPLKSAPAPAPGNPLGPAMPTGLAPGSEAPQFELSGLEGASHSLAAWRGRPVLIIFFNPGCGFCTDLAPALAELPMDGAGGRPFPVILTAGGAAANRGWTEAAGIRCPVLLDDGALTAAAYDAQGTPMGYLVDAEGRIAAPIAIGAEALLALAEPGAPTAGDCERATPVGGAAVRGTRTLADSRIKRDGLSIGTEAPDFTLPSLDGGELALDSYRGRRVLLVFSDPHCPPCQELAPRLEQAHRQIRDLQVLMVSRGAAEENRAKAAQHGLTFPIVLQRKWEISKRYAMFATPIAYLIDSDGVIASDVAVGPESILSLVESAPQAIAA